MRCKGKEETIKAMLEFASSVINSKEASSNMEGMLEEKLRASNTAEKEEKGFQPVSTKNLVPVGYVDKARDEECIAP